MAANNRSSKRQPISVDGMIYDHRGERMAQCTVRNISIGGAQLELMQEIVDPVTFCKAILSWEIRNLSAQR